MSFSLKIIGEKTEKYFWALCPFFGQAKKVLFVPKTFPELPSTCMQTFIAISQTVQMCIANRQTGRQADRQTGRQADKQTQSLLYIYK